MAYKKKGEPIAPRTRWVTFNGQRIRVYSMGYLCHMTNRSSRCLYEYMKEDILPRPLLDLGTHYTWWTAMELIGYTSIIKNGNIRPRFKTRFAIRNQTQEYKRMLRNFYQKNPQRIRRSLGKDVDWRTVTFQKREAKFHLEAQRLLAMLPPRLPTDADDPVKMKALQLADARRALEAKRKKGLIKNFKGPLLESKPVKAKKKFKLKASK